MQKTLPNAIDLKDYLEEVPCNLCGSKAEKVWTESAGFKIVECAHCGLVFVNPRLNNEGLQKAYSDEYFQTHTEGGALEKRLLMYDIEIKELESLTSSGSIIDVGCGGGFFLNRLGNHWQKYGVEFNPVAAKSAQENFGIDVRVGEFTNLGYDPESFDVVNLRGTIEHFPDPYKYLEESYRVLKKDGLIAINTPNVGAFCAKLYKDKFNMVDPVHHIYYFSDKTLEEMLKKVGFKIVRKRFFYFGTPYIHWTDGFKILAACFRKLFSGNVGEKKSPAFFDNIVHLYAQK